MTVRPIRDFNLDTVEGEAKLRYVLENYSKSVWVRHPMARLVSAWNDKLRYGVNKFYREELGVHIVKSYRNQSETAKQSNNIIANSPTLEEFFKFLIYNATFHRKNPAIYDVHCKFGWGDSFFF